MAKKEAKEQRVEELIQAAVDEFTEKGYDGASMSSIAGRAGVSKGGLYHHFRSKAEILMAANHKLLEPIVGMVERACQASSSREGLRLFVREYISYWDAHARELSFFLMSLSKAMLWPELWPEYETEMESVIDTMAGVFRKGVESGEFLPHDSRGSAVTMLLALDGALAYRVLDKKLELAQTIRHFEEKFIDSLETAPQ
ncbi:MAG TPA: TetR/AcrR family transcriptional regulator [Negativicutes bacterium]|nr:TetR/AcrR family transcriptional regulator [Negativicutes bacterium]